MPTGLVTHYAYRLCEPYLSLISCRRPDMQYHNRSPYYYHIIVACGYIIPYQYHLCFLVTVPRHDIILDALGHLCLGQLCTHLSRKNEALIARCTTLLFKLNAKRWISPLLLSGQFGYNRVKNILGKVSFARKHPIEIHVCDISV